MDLSAYHYLLMLMYPKSLLAPTLWVAVPLMAMLGAVTQSDLDPKAAFLDSHKGDRARLRAQIDSLSRDISHQAAQNRRLESELDWKERYIVIDTWRNRLRLYDGDRILEEAPCATGSGKNLSYRWQSWHFSTPLGRFQVQKKEEGPVWIKPVWAFVEKEEPVPAFPEAFERFQIGVLGEYALHFGNGYMIHGTLYENRLGQSITPVSYTHLTLPTN